uniref:HTH CENPB-type domain-containing protein n=1 Tax=Amphimedon queenslandica TaxID=400682 RepID=A0A1X7UVR0_AMPQE
MWCHFKHSSVSTWKLKYLAQVKHQVKKGETPNVCSLTGKKRGRPLLLCERLDADVQHYIHAVHDGGGIVTTRITAAAATAIVRKTDRNLLAGNGGPIVITTGWAKSLLYRLNFVKRRGSSAAKITVSNFEELKQQYLFDFKSVVVMDEIPPQLIFIWD